MMSVRNSWPERPILTHNRGRDDAPEAVTARLLADYKYALAQSLALLRTNVGPGRTRAAIQERAKRRLDRLRRFLAFLGHPERQAAVVHVTGTSGKGSTAAMIAAIVSGAGYGVGLATSPYLQAATEKVQIGGRILHPTEFRDGLDEVLDAGNRWRRRSGDDEDLSYGEYWFALTMLVFQRHAVDLAVVEVGAGGRFDLTNVVEPVVAVITNVGLDHIGSLGPTLADIAWQKAGIIKPGACVVTGERNPAIRAHLEREAKATAAVFVVATRTDRLPPNLPREPVPAQNAAVAVASVEALAGVGFVVPGHAIGDGLASAALPGRGERMPPGEGASVLIDGAHSPPKMRAFVDGLHLGDATAQRWIGVLAIVAGKGVDEMLEALIPALSGLITTSVVVTGKPFLNPTWLARRAHQLGFIGPIAIEEHPHLAFEAAQALATELGAGILVTGSLYLVGALRERWYSTNDIVVQQSSWPVWSG